MNDDEIKPLTIPGWPVGNVVPIGHARLLHHLRLIKDAERMIQEAFGIDPRLLTDRSDQR